MKFQKLYMLGSIHFLKDFWTKLRKCMNNFTKEIIKCKKYKKRNKDKYVNATLNVAFLSPVWWLVVI